ncbi:hypothetical protein RIEGSTA812A_PEG_255 [invertebrate metagenome]|uniref:Uncharacterized protein n=1 Tax=invertebrate metagenome TaxID=1711999 RepID=A0A484HAI6_9ZZZZ
MLPSLTRDETIRQTRILDIDRVLSLVIVLLSAVAALADSIPRFMRMPIAAGSISSPPYAPLAEWLATYSLR